MYAHVPLPQSMAMIVSQNACDAFDRYVDGRMTAHNSYNFQMVKRTDYDVKNVGFMSDLNTFYAVSDNDFRIIQINEDFSDTLDISEKHFQNQINSISQNKTAKEIFLVSNGTDLSVLNANKLTVDNIPVPPLKTSLAWTTDTKFLTYDVSGCLKLYDVGKFECISTSNMIPGEGKVFPHPTEPYALVTGMNLQLIDLRCPGRVASIPMQGRIGALSWMPNDKSGIIIGYQNGSIDLFSLADQKAIVTQQISYCPISAVEFCRSKPGTALIASDTDIVFANLRSWGYGRLTVTRTHQGHIGYIQDAHWYDGDELKVISCDNRRIINVFQMPDSYLPVYQE